MTTQTLTVSAVSESTGELVELEGASVQELGRLYGEFEGRAGPGSATVYDEAGFVRGWVHADGSWRCS